ncbi:hypothetical protein RJ640_023280 [Escallonia rubra]|uniref:Dof zinc finger protein n=1 Tax=Escallonia rubra TaxID=112253 RepID=A0AA88RNQ4_9ASTE|nr:hypothetical protein RJ640_023280 [Escallonia rubra]
MDAAQWPEGIGVVKPMEGLVEKKPIRPQKPQALNCPRCNSSHTKFCYYNNYSLSQPRYFCKTCRRYWTEGGSLRNVPVGGGSRKNKRSTSSSKNLAPQVQNPKIHDGQDLNLAYPPTTGNYKNSVSDQFVHETYHPNTSTTTSAMEFLKNGIASGGFLSSSYMSMMPVSDSNALYSSPGLNFHDFKPNPNFSSQLGFESDGYGNHLQGVQETHSARLFFPFEDLKPVSTTTTSEFEQNKGQGDSTTAGYWNGGSW